MSKLMSSYEPIKVRMSCSFCKETFAVCTNFGQAHYMCILCEEKIADRLKLILDFE